MDAERTPRATYRFDRFALDLARGALLGDGGAEVPLRAKSFALLRLFVENAGQLLDRDTIMAAVWPDVVVSDESIAQCVSDIRKALGGEAQRLLRTVPRRGYLFAAEVSLVDPVAAPRAVRRLAAILAADVVGYSRLMGQDEPGTLARLKAHRQECVAPLVARHGGRVVNHPGDSILCAFASVVEAVACAVAIQDGMVERESDLPAPERLRFRIGVNVGDVIVEGEEIFGDGVNVAARLEGVAEPGGICVSGKVHDEVQGKLDLGFEDLGELALKNIARPVRVWRVAGAAAAARRVAGLPLAEPTGDAAQRPLDHGAGEGVVVDLARFRRGEPPAVPAAHSTPDAAPALLADHNLPQPNPNFVGRASELVALRQALVATGRSTITQSRHAISGLGGIGKTQLALAYAYARLGDYDLVRWLRAEEPTVLAADYTSLAQVLGVDPRITDQAALVAALRAKLEQAGCWLLVFDNATDPRSLEAYLPRIGGGHILVTSRWQDWEGTATALELETLPETEAVALLLGDGAGEAAERAAATELAHELGRLPLALAQARAFMRARKLGIAGYRQQFAAARPKVLAWRPPNAGYPLAVAQAWQTSVDHAVHNCPAAGELLQLLSFLAPEDIPRDLLGAKPEALPEALRDPFDRDGAIEALGRYSLVRVESKSLTMHRLVRAVTRDGLDEPTGARCAATAVALVDAALPPSTWDNIHRPTIEKLLPQALAAAEAADRFGVGLRGLGAILTIVGEYHHWGGANHEAEAVLRRAVAVREQVLGPEHPDLAISLHKLANVWQAVGRLTEAEPLYRRVVAIRERTLDPEHPRVALSLARLGRLYHDMERRPEAEPLFQRALAIAEQAIAREHHDLDTLLVELAHGCVYTGRFSEAEPLLRHVLEVRARTLGPEHPHVAIALHHLAVLHLNTGRPAEAGPLLERAVAVFEQALGPEHPYLGDSLHRLAQAHLDAGRPAEAELPLRRALAISERAFGPEHASLTRRLHALGRLYRDAGRLAEAEASFRRCLELAEKAYPPDRRLVLNTLECLAALLDQLGRREEAAALRSRADAIRQRG